ncbi:hypothetical protein J7T55_003305 [Diaporthe amygdali]|uniref:uncharacterized protein n=1 Tax=Phomopsis amygdali TaxID=1214568 RepID=UPI0022FEDAA3|nr:uncharacterized protein J7T55_003305 [Diaporthe amygdali]KAJ0100686.1 hypothetical protein J7T55_003305 [Diaporthe amygdali]
MEEEKIDHFSVLLTESQAESLKEFNEGVRRCKTDAEKFSLCRQMRSRLLERHDSLGVFIAEKAILATCPEHQSYKERRQTRKRADDDEEWQRFVGVAASGSDVIEKCLPYLKLASLVWGRDKIQHYLWHDRGLSFCKKLGAVAKMMPWQEFVTKANRLLWWRATMERKHRRRHVRNSPDPLDENELHCLRAWSGEHSYVKDKDPDLVELDPKGLGPEEVPDGFGFDKFGLLVHSQHALPATQNGTNAPEIGHKKVTLLESEPVVGSRGSADQDTTMISPVSEITSEAPSSDLTIPDSTSGQRSEFAARRESTDSRALNTPETGSSSCSDPGAPGEEADVQAAEDAHNANDDRADIVVDPGPPKARAPRRRKGRVFNSISKTSECPTEGIPGPLGTTNLERCCPATISAELLQILDLGTADRAAKMRVLVCHVRNSGGAIPRELCVKHVRRFAEALVLSEQDSQDISPAASGLRRRRASFTDADGNHAYRRIRVDEQSYNQGPSAITIAQQSRPTHDRVGDEAFRKQVLHQLEIKRRQAVPSSQGEMRDDLVYNILLDSTPPVLSGSSTTEAHFWSGDEAAIGFEVHLPGVPVFTQGQQRFRWREGHPIRQLFDRIVDFDRLVAVQTSSLGTYGHPFQHKSLHKSLREVCERFLRAQPTTDPWSLLDVRSPLPPSILPSFLDGDNCQLLSRMRDAVQAGAEAEAEGSTRPGHEWRESSEWALLSEGGHNTVPRIDSHGLSTWITAQEGCIGFGWMSRPTRGEYRDWMLNPTAPHRDSRWRYVVLRPGWTVFSPSGTIHFLFRPERVQTLALGGHILQWTGISLWLDVVGEQLKYAGATGEDVGKYAKSISVVLDLVVKKVKSGGPDELGDKEELQKIRNHITAMRTSTAGLSIPSRIEEELMRLVSGSVHLDQDADHA